ncbi:Skp family chaperone for outer membrane proteins [Paraburkholderia sp. MM5482-R1]
MTLLTGMFSKRVACALALAMTLGVGMAHAQEARIAAVNSDRILRESAAAKAAQLKLEAEFAKRDKDLADMAQKLKSMSDALDKNGATMSATDRAQKQRDLSQLDSDFQRKQREFREDLNQRRNEELAGSARSREQGHQADRRNAALRSDRPGSGVREPAHRYHRPGAEGTCGIGQLRATKGNEGD